MFFDIHSLMLFPGRSRLTPVNKRYFATLLLMLSFILLNSITAKAASAMIATKENSVLCVGLCTTQETASIRNQSCPVASCGSVNGSYPIFPCTVHENGHRGVYARLRPRIVMIPRMNRVPKPKSVYRLFARAPGSNSDEVE